VLVLGLTGSIGMGKSTTSAMFRSAGVPVHDSDRTVHDLYAGEATPLIEAAFPGTTRDGIVDRGLLSKQVIGQPEAMKRLEAIVHPLVRDREANFIQSCRARNCRIVLVDIPLLFETRNERMFDAIIVVSAPPDIQAARVLERPGMTRDKLDAILAKQVPDVEKRRRAHFVIDTGRGFHEAAAQVSAILRCLAAQQ
jgi:dephospho-CoA kinase